MTCYNFRWIFANCSVNFHYKWRIKMFCKQTDLAMFKDHFARSWRWCYRRLTTFAIFEDSVNSFARALYRLHVFRTWIDRSIKSSFDGFLLKVSRSSVVEIPSCVYTKTILFNLGDCSPRLQRIIVKILQAYITFGFYRVINANKRPKCSNMYSLWRTVGYDSSGTFLRVCRHFSKESRRSLWRAIKCRLFSVNIFNHLVCQALSSYLRNWKLTTHRKIPSIH